MSDGEELRIIQDAIQKDFDRAFEESCLLAYDEYTKREVPSKGKWIVSVQHSHDFINYEISCVREGNIHGQNSYGWFDNNKILIAESSENDNQDIRKMLFKEQLRLAYKIKEELNKI